MALRYAMLPVALLRKAGSELVGSSSRYTLPFFIAFCEARSPSHGCLAEPVSARAGPAISTLPVLSCDGRGLPNLPSQTSCTAGAKTPPGAACDVAVVSARAGPAQATLPVLSGDGRGPSNLPAQTSRFAGTKPGAACVLAIESLVHGLRSYSRAACCRLHSARSHVVQRRCWEVLRCGRWLALECRGTLMTLPAS